MSHTVDALTTHLNFPCSP